MGQIGIVGQIMRALLMLPVLILAGSGILSISGAFRAATTFQTDVSVPAASFRYVRP